MRDVQPAIELVADTSQCPDVFEAQRFLESEAPSVFGARAAEQGAMAKVTGAVYEIGQQCPTDASAMVIGVDIDGTLDGMPVGFLGAPGRE